MKFRPCIDIHNGKVKQIVGGSLKDEMNQAIDNFVSEQDAAWYARLYREKGLIGGHIILLNPEGSEYYDADLVQALGALEAFPGGLMIGGGIHSDNAMKFIRAGASHVIVTSYVLNEETLNLLAPYCSEFLIHAVDVEGKASGIEEELASMLGVWDGIPITYAGGVGSLDDVELLKKLGNRRLDVTIGSALDIFGGTIPFEKAADIS